MLSLEATFRICMWSVQGSGFTILGLGPMVMELVEGSSLFGRIVGTTLRRVSVLNSTLSRLIIISINVT